MYNLKERIKYCLNIFLGALQKDSWQCLNRGDILLVRHDNDCGYTFQGKAYAHLVDTLGDLCTKKGLLVQSVATPFSVLVGTRAYYSPTSYNHSIIPLLLIQKIIAQIKGADIATKWVKSRRITLWCNILDKTKPKVIFGIQPDEYLCCAGKIKGIPVYDLQHGVIADEHPWYGEKYRVSTPVEDLPDGFLCWDNQSVATISKWTDQKGIKVLNIGNPWFLRFAKADPDDLLVQEAMNEGKILDDDRPCILLTLQWGMRIEYPDDNFNGVIVDALERVILDTLYKYNWILRLHPVQLRGEEKEITLSYLKKTFGEEKTQNWVNSSQIPLPVVLRQTDIHITDLSTVVIEARWMGICSGLLNQQLSKGGKWEGYFSYERSIGMAKVLPHNPEIIKKWISDTLAKGRSESTMKDSSQTLEAFIDEVVIRCKS